MKFATAISVVILILNAASTANAEKGLDAEHKAAGRTLTSKKMSKKGTTKKMSKKGKNHKEQGCRNKQFHCPEQNSVPPSHIFGGTVAICNRSGGSFSLVDPTSLETVTEQILPDDGEPMYFALTPSKSEIWVTDRFNNRLVIYKMVGCDLVYDGYVSTSAGAFHSMITQRTGDPYPIVALTCDIDKVVDIFDLTTRRRLATLPSPDEASADNMQPHDVTINGDYIFVTFLDTNGVGPGYVASYSATDFSLLSVLATEADPHVAIRDGPYLFIAARSGSNPGVVVTVEVPGLEEINSVERPSPHGMFLSFDGNYLYTTNIAGGGEMAVDVFDAKTGAHRSDCPTVTTTFGVAHNPAASLDGTKLYITHSGGTVTVNSVFDIDDYGCLDPDSERTFDTNLNPFGIAVLPPANDLMECANAGY